MILIYLLRNDIIGIYILRIFKKICSVGTFATKKRDPDMTADSWPPIRRRIFLLVIQDQTVQARF